MSSTSSDSTPTSSLESHMDLQSIPYAVAVATPVSDNHHDQAYCRLCDEKDIVIKAQEQEINQLKKLVEQLVAVLAKQATAQTPQDLKPSSCPSTVPTAQSLKQSRNINTLNRSSSSRIFSNIENEAESSTTMVRKPTKSDENVPVLLELPRTCPKSPSSTMLRLCRLKQLKQDSSPSASARCDSKRRIYVSVANRWGYYNGPPLEQNKILHGCVVRFEDGDINLGDMMCLVPTSSLLTDESGLMFHGRGTLYAKDGSVIRGLFHKNQPKS